MAETDNPLIAVPDTPFGLPPFAALRPEHYGPAYARAMDDHRAEIAAIVADPAPPDFDNTIAALERAGEGLRRADGAFWISSATVSTPQMLALERELAPKLAAHYSAIGLDAGLFGRIAAVWEKRDALNLSAEQARVLTLTYDGFKRSGAMLPQDSKKRYAEISERLATLYAQFSQNVLKDETDWTMMLEASDLDGLPQTLREAAAAAAAERGAPDKYAITLARSSVEPFVTWSARRDLREKAFKAWTERGELTPDTSNHAIMNEIVALRDESARMLGYETYAHYKLEDQMAKTPDRVRDLLERVWKPARAQVERERAVLQDVARRAGDNHEIAAHDWRYFAEKARRELHAIDENEIRAYLTLDNVIAAAFDVAHKLFGIAFREVEGLALHHPDARAFEARDERGEHVALFVADYYARPGKRGGAWMSAMRGQSNLDGRVRPIVVNVMNFAKAPDGKATEISLSDARTLFHEFGHGLHGMLSDVTYPSIAGTSVARDFVEFPSQLYEHWMMRREVLSRFARHARTGEPMPDDLIARIEASRNFNQGFATIEYLSCALVDLDLHLKHPDTGFDVAAFERADLARIDMPHDMVMRHRTPHFGHIFNGDGYAAGYYSYLWSETLDADGFKAFEETGDVFDPAVARRLKDFVYAAGGRETPENAYRHFRGRDPDPQALIEKRGFATESA